MNNITANNIAEINTASAVRGVIASFVAAGYFAIVPAAGVTDVSVVGNRKFAIVVARPDAMIIGWMIDFGFTVEKVDVASFMVSVPR